MRAMTDEFAAVALALLPSEFGSDEVWDAAAVQGPIGEHTGRYASLVHLDSPLPYRLRVVADLGPDELRHAPEPEVVASQLASFIGQRPVVTAGPRMVGALSGLGAAGSAPVFDLCELAELLRPGLPAYDLRSLAASFGAGSPVSGRAAGEADLIAVVYSRLREHVTQLDPLVVEEIVLLTSSCSWPLRLFFRELAATRPATVYHPAKSKDAMRALAPATHRQHTEALEIAQVLECAATPGKDQGLERREQQIEMASAVTEALDNDQHLLVEAGTGTGKSLAYLLPASIMALRNDDRVVISTNTINLQEQIVSKDIPRLRSLLAGCGPADVRDRIDSLHVVLLKGRRNYLCLQRLATFRHAPSLSEAEIRFLARVLLWVAQTGTGDRSELRVRPEEELLWNRISADGANCLGTRNQFIRSGECQLLRARRQAEAAHLVVVNHALLLSDIASGSRALPGYDRLVIDEAHNLEDEATDQFGFRISQGEIGTYLDGIVLHGREREAGLVPDLRSTIGGLWASGALAAQSGYLLNLLTVLAESTDHARKRVPELFTCLQGFAQRHAEASGDYDSRLLLTPAKRAQPEWEQVELVWENLRLALQQVEGGIERLGIALGEGAGIELADADAFVGGLGAQQVAGSLLRRNMESVIDRHDAERIVWITLGRSGVVLSSAPLDVGTLLESQLFARKASVVLTSATLSANGSYDYVRGRLGLSEAETLTVGSPFDYRRAVLLLLPLDMPEPSQPLYQRALEDRIVDLCQASQGRALVLFTSHGALRATYHAIRPRLAQNEIRVLAQGLDGSPADLLASLRMEGNTVVLGTASFWEGVDVVGDALSMLIIAKLPFSVPTDPVFSARSELFEEPFRQYALPQAILRFKQGFGRLIRQQGDSGVVAVLDKRMLSKAYGKAFLASLPPATVKQLPGEELAGAAREWLA